MILVLSGEDPTPLAHLSPRSIPRALDPIPAALLPIQLPPLPLATENWVGISQRPEQRSADDVVGYQEENQHSQSRQYL